MMGKYKMNTKKIILLFLLILFIQCSNCKKEIIQNNNNNTNSTVFENISLDNQPIEKIYPILKDRFFQALIDKDNIKLENVLKDEQKYVINKKLKKYQLIEEKFQDEWPLIYVANKKFDNGVKTLIKYNANANVQNKLGQTALMISTLLSNQNLVKFLAPKTNLDIEIFGNEGGNAIYWAYKKQLSDMLVLLENLGAVHPEKKEILLQAALNNNFKIVKSALSSNIDPNISNNVGDSALILASAGGHLDIVKTMLIKKAHINYQDHDGYSALLASLWKSKNEVSKYLLENNADVTLKHNSKRTALMFAAWKCNVNIVNLILQKNKMNINAQDNDGWTALMFAIFKGDIATVKLLLDNKADINIQNNTGVTAIELANKKKIPEIIELLSNRN